MSRQVSSSTAPPSGRLELLRWINASTRSSYPTVESLRDGVAYATLISAIIMRHATNWSQDFAGGGGEADGDPLHAVQQQCQSICNRIDVEVTSQVKNPMPSSTSSATNAAASGASPPPPPDPQSDSIQTRERCEKNFLLVQDLLRQCIPRAMSLTLETKRLAAGKLQEHLRLLQWCSQFASRASVPPSARQQTQGRSTNATGLAKDRRRSSSGAVGAPTPSPNIKTDNNTNASTLRSRSSGSSTISHVATKVTPTAVAEVKPTVVATSQLPKQQQGSHYDPTQYQPHRPKQGSDSTTVVDETLVQLLRDIETLESTLFRRGQSHHREEDANVSGKRVTLETVSSLLSERDMLWQTLSAIEHVVREEGTGYHQSEDSAFVDQMLRIFHVPSRS